MMILQDQNMSEKIGVAFTPIWFLFVIIAVLVTEIKSVLEDSTLLKSTRMPCCPNYKIRAVDYIPAPGAIFR